MHVSTKGGRTVVSTQGLKLKEYEIIERKKRVVLDTRESELQLVEARRYTLNKISSVQTT